MFHGYEKIFKSVQSCRQDFDSGVLRWFYGQKSGFLSRQKALFLRDKSGEGHCFMKG